MIPEKLLEILKKDGIVAIATLGRDGPHLVNTWTSYVRISADGRLLIPCRLHASHGGECCLQP